MGHVDLWQVEDSVALLHEACVACESSSADCVSVVSVLDAIVVCISLYPTWHVECHDFWRCAFSNAHAHVVVFAYDSVLAVEVGADSAAVCHFGASCHCERWRSNRDALKLACEVAHMRWLVVAYTLPYHSVAVLVVVPECVEAMFRCSNGGVDAKIGVVTCAEHHLLAPVAEDVARGAWVVLRVVVHLAS